MDPDEASIRSTLYERDIDAFLDQDWSQVEDTFDEAAFCGYRANDPKAWSVGYPTLQSYRDDWLRQAATFADEPREPLRRALMALSRITDVQISEDRAVVRKEFDGEAVASGSTHVFAWVTYYFLRLDSRGWLVTGFVGGLPLPGRDSAALI
jgi:hypothetical protein